ncbi:tetratricopeptide repeat protein [Candidatus Poribacteria bacterium]|nr:tetratricopeptide repeat protein [Candidatus Poribacteria bacterium]
MKKLIVAEILIIAVFVIGFFVGKSLNSDKNYERYYERAEAAWLKAQKADNPPVTLEDPDQKRLRKVRALYRQVFENYPESRWADDAIYQLASRIARTDEEAFALYRRLINHYPDSEWADDSLYTIAIANYRIGENMKSKDDPQFADPYYDRAFALFDQLIRDYPGSTLVDVSRFNRSMCYYAKGNWSRALDAFDQLREDFRDKELIHSIVYYTGMIFNEKQEYDKARIEFMNVVDAGQPELAPLAQFGIAQTYFAEGKYDVAIEAYKQVIEKYVETKSAEDAQFYIGWAYEKQKRYDAAITQLEEAIEKYPRNENASNAQFYVAQIYYAKNDTDGAIAAYRKVADNPTFDYDIRRSAQYWIGYILEKAGNAKEAIEAYQKLLKNFPEPHHTAQHPSNNINDNYIQKLRSEGG